MERLQPVLKQKFWILLFVAIVMTFAGWWMATGEMSAAITKRKGEIEASFNSIPKGQIPNESWAKGLSAINATQDASIKASQLGLWKRQQAKMTWPEGVDPVNGYWGKFPNDMRELFRDSYFDEVMLVWKMLHPMLDTDGSGVVLFPLRNMKTVLKKGPWPVTPPESDVMWEAREDLWLLEGLFQSITALNGGMDGTRSDAIIHQIDKLELRGGGPKLKAPDAAPGGPGMAMPGGMGPGAGAQGAQGAQALTAGLAVVSPEFDPAEEFGDDGSSAAASGGGGGMGGIGGGPMMGTGAPGADAAAAKPISRYILNDPAMAYKTRGFYLSVKMDHTKIPLLIEELTSNEKSVWPVEIVRVQMTRINEDDGNSFNSGVNGLRGPGQPNLVGLGGRDEDGVNPFGTPPAGRGPGGVDPGSNSQLLAAKVAFENVLKDPVMAQVTICGIFTLYRKVDEPPPVTPVPAATAPAADEAVPPEGKIPPGDEPPATVENPPTAAVTDGDDPTEPAGKAADKPESSPDKPETPATNGEGKPDSEPRPEPKLEKS